ncbi:MAG TPA: hypothetical protein VMZ52_12515 [Bryobacteraceae bacterium]|nr:hypothetical protein [Bryobacteraceae bacterium]
MVHIALDSVVFEDGRFAGRDLAGRFRLRSAEFRAERDFIAAVNASSGDRLQAYLMGLQRPAEGEDPPHYEARLRELGERMLAALRTSPEDEVKLSMSQSLMFPKVHKKLEGPDPVDL